MNLLIEQMLKDRKVRLDTVFKSHYWFFHFYFSHYIQYATADFHREMFSLTEDVRYPLVSITAFRGSAKSTIMNLSYPLWAILGSQQRKFVLIVGQTQQQARQHLQNIKRELEANHLLKADLGPFKEIDGDGPWNANALLIENHNAKIMAVSVDQSVRGLRHGAHRPDLIICDDVEDLASTKTLEGRDKIYDWVKGELLPSGNPGTRMIFIGNLLHEDCLLRRLQQEISLGSLMGTFREYSLLRDDGTPLWPGKFKDAASINAERMRIGSEASWQREYLLRIMPDANRVVQRSWISYYDELPQRCRVIMAATGVDLAISERDTADYTAMVSAKIFDGFPHIYVLPNPVNERLSSHHTINRIEKLSEILGEGYKAKTPIFVEDVGYQRAVVETLVNHRYPAEGVSPMGQDKRARLALIAHAIQDGTIVFPKTGCEKLIMQLVGHGSERYDDLADAFSLLMLKMTEKMDRLNRSSGLGIGFVDKHGRTVILSASRPLPPEIALEIEFQKNLQNQLLEHRRRLGLI